MSGERIYFPNSTQFKRMNESLKAIAGAMNRNIDISTWEGIQKAVRSGIAPSVLPVGTQLVVNHGVYGDCLYDVVAHNYFKSNHDENAHSMTLMSHDVLPSIQFDSPEAFYYANTLLPAGTYNFTIPNTYGEWLAGTYQFTLTYSVPSGGILSINGSAVTPLTSLSVISHRARTDAFSSEMVSITSGSAGTNLGTFGIELNHSHRVSYGSDNYKESALRQFLNSSSSVGNVWTPQTKFDRPPEWVTSVAGFVADLDADFLSVVGSVVVPCSANSTYEAPDSTVTKDGKYTLVDKFYLASQQEISGTSTGIVADDSLQLPYYEGSTNADRIKYNGDSAAPWRLRSPGSLVANNVRVIERDGVVRNNFATLKYYYAVMCTIV